MTVSQGSAAMSLRYGGTCNDHFVANFVLSLAMKEFWKLINISRSYQHEYGVLFFLTQQCTYFVMFGKPTNSNISRRMYALTFYFSLELMQSITQFCLQFFHLECAAQIDKLLRVGSHDIACTFRLTKNDDYIACFEPSGSLMLAEHISLHFYCWNSPPLPFPSHSIPLEVSLLI